MGHGEKINELLDQLADDLRVTILRKKRSGGIDPSNYDPEEYVLAKIVVTAALREHVNSYACEKYEATIRNLENF